jgi:hypothetical protein
MEEFNSPSTVKEKEQNMNLTTRHRADYIPSTSSVGPGAVMTRSGWPATAAPDNGVAVERREVPGPSPRLACLATRKVGCPNPP